MHKYMNRQLNLCAVIMHSKPNYKSGKKNKFFTISYTKTLLSNAKTRYGVLILHICASQMKNSDITVQLLICMTGLLSLHYTAIISTLICQ